jgi:hypothetical protein
VGDNLIMLDKRTDTGNTSSSGDINLEGMGGHDTSSMGDPSENLPF